MSKADRLGKALFQQRLLEGVLRAVTRRSPGTMVLPE
jgi:hypothetical protein